MSLKDILTKIKQEIKVLQGEETKDKLYCSDHTYSSTVGAQQAFKRAKAKLFDVNKWSDLPGINSSFELFDAQGRKSAATMPQVGFYIRIVLPGPSPENWVNISSLHQTDTMAEFVVHPSEKPEERHDPNAEIKHFFIKEASSTFRVELEENELIACEIGRNEGINNQGDEAGDRAAINTLIAEGGWAGFQGLQWNKLTDYLVHHQEAKTDS